MDPFIEVRALSDKELIEATEAIAAEDRRCTVRMLTHLGEVDRRDILVAMGYPSAFKYATLKLGFPEAIAYWRIHSARAARAYPILLELVEKGEINISTITLLCPVFTDRNHMTHINAVRGMTRKEVEGYVANLSPSAARRDVVTRQGPMLVAKGQWPAPPQASPAGAVEQKALDIVEALDAERRRLHFDVGPETADLLERAREILRHKYPFASLEDIVKEALNVLLDHKDFDRTALTPSRKTGETEGRGIPMWVRKAVWVRDDGRCVYAGDDGVVCGERSFVEFDHVVPYAKGGRSDDPANVRLLCRAHNQLAARQAFGRA